MNRSCDVYEFTGICRGTNRVYNAEYMSLCFCWWVYEWARFIQWIRALEVSFGSLGGLVIADRKMIER